MNPPFRIEFDLSHDPGEQNPREAQTDLAARAERLRAREIHNYGGLWIHRNGGPEMRLFGEITGLQADAPFLRWSDRGRFPEDLQSPGTLRIDRRLATGEPFDLRITRFGYGARLPSAALSVEQEGSTQEIAMNSAASPVAVEQRPITPLSEEQQAEVVAKMRALGYLAGQSPSGATPPGQQPEAVPPPGRKTKPRTR
jgi:hypothetical protein